MKKPRQETRCPRPLSARLGHTPTPDRDTRPSPAAEPSPAFRERRQAAASGRKAFSGSHEGLGVPPGTGCPPQKGQGGCWQDRRVGGLGLHVACDSSSVAEPAGASPLRPGAPHAAPGSEHWLPLFQWGCGQGREAHARPAPSSGRGTRAPAMPRSTRSIVTEAAPEASYRNGGGAGGRTGRRTDGRADGRTRSPTGLLPPKEARGARHLESGRHEVIFAETSDERRRHPAGWKEEIKHLNWGRCEINGYLTDLC